MALAEPAPVSDLPLDERLVEVALELLAEEGLEALTLRSIARRAGVSHGAPARHFNSLADLLAEVAARGFALLGEAMVRSDAELPDGASAEQRLATAARAYVDCAVANSALFALMFRPDHLDVTNASFVRDSMGAFDGLLHHVRAAQTRGWHADREARQLAGSLWALVHGLASLWAQGAYQGPIPNASLDDALTTTLELVRDDRQGAAG